MKISVLAAVITVPFVLFTSLSVPAAEEPSVRSLRGDVPIDQGSKAPALKNTRAEQAPEARNYVQQPPLIPHKVRDYKITKAHNKCMDCHSWRKYREMGAVKISATHFRDRAGMDIDHVSPLRYFCNQCHVPQKDAKPLVENAFKPIETIKAR